MKQLTNIVLTSLLVGGLGLATANGVPGDLNRGARLKVLIVTGQNNHDWEVSSRILQRVFDASALFTVDRVVSPPKGGDMSGFNPAFSRYDVVCLDYNGDPWPEAAWTALVHYVREGGGLVVFHAADNAFPHWKAYNEMIGLGGWGGRTATAGPYLEWRDGKWVRDYSPGKAGAHGRQVEYKVVTRRPGHPIMRGLPARWLHARDELYYSLRGPAEHMEILASATQSTATGGTGKPVPVLMTIRYGRGRVFHSVMGHVGPKYHDAILCGGFITTLLRGAEWAATGRVTQTVSPAFPTAEAVSIWRQYDIPADD